MKDGVDISIRCVRIDTKEYGNLTCNNHEICEHLVNHLDTLDAILTFDCSVKPRSSDNARGPQDENNHGYGNTHWRMHVIFDWSDLF